MTRRRWWRADVLAPIVALLVVAALGWLGAQILAWSGIPRPWLDRATAPSVATYEARPAPGSPVPSTPLPAASTAGTAIPLDPAPTTGTAWAAPTDGPPAVVGDEDIDTLRARRLVIPVDGVKTADLESTFADPRGARVHEAMDIAAPRGAPVVAVEDGQIAKLFTSERGGLTIYQFDPTHIYAYYYAHLDGYASGLRQGLRVVRGQVLGYVGTTGNAPKDTPHLHFAIFKLGPQQRWWEGVPLDPDRILR